MRTHEYGVLIVVLIITEYSVDRTQSVLKVILSFLITFRNSEPILLVELGGMAQFTPIHQAAMIDLFGCFQFAQVVVSLSSGGGYFISNTMNSTFKKIVRKIKHEKRIHFSPLEEKEAELFMNIYKVPSGLDMNEYKRLTNYNQSLLFACHKCDNMRDVKSEIDMVTRDYFEEIRLSLESDNFSWIRRSIPECMDMLCYAANGEMIHQSKWHNYQLSCLCAENLTYVVHSTTLEFKLAINFPQTYDRLMDMLWTNGTHTNLLINNPIVNDYQYERNICSRIKKLQFSYCEQRVAGIYTESVDVKFCSRMEPNEPVTKLLSGVLVMLRPTHPVIDAVLYVQLADKELLLLIQVSISTYKWHKNSQEGDLVSSITGCERTHDNKTPVRNWLQYYCNCLPTTCNKCIYLYLSPKELHEGEDEHSQRPDEVLGEGGVGNNPCTLKFFLGLITNNTDCADFIKHEHNSGNFC